MRRTPKWIKNRARAYDLHITRLILIKMEENEIKPIREKVLSNKKLSKIVEKYMFDISQRERGLFLSLIEESYNLGFEEGQQQ